MGRGGSRCWWWRRGPRDFLRAWSLLQIPHSRDKAVSTSLRLLTVAMNPGEKSGLMQYHSRILRFPFPLRRTDLEAAWTDRSPAGRGAPIGIAKADRRGVAQIMSNRFNEEFS